MKKFDLSHNFLQQLVDIDNNEIQNLISIEDENKPRGKYTYQLNGKPWNDPDESNLNLYEYHLKIWKNKYPKENAVVNKPMEIYYNGKAFKIFTEIDGKNYRLGSDYIGFSKQWITKNISAKDVGKALSETRCFAGHMLWCKGFSKGWYEKKDGGFGYSDKFKPNFITINQAKGGAKGVFDRIDWTLKLLRVYYDVIKMPDLYRESNFNSNDNVKELVEYIELSEDEKKVKKCIYAESVRRIFYAFENSREWLLLFVNFPGFIDYFALDDIVDKKNEFRVIKLSPWLPVLPVDYKRYMEDSVEFINKRKKRLEEKLN